MANFPVNLVLKAFDGVSSKFKRIQDRFGALSNAATKLKLKMSVLGQRLNFEGIKKSLGQVSSSFGNVANGARASFLRLGAVVAGVAVGLGALVKHSISAGDNFKKMSERTGLTVEGFQELRYAAEASGVSSEEFDNSLLKLNKSFGELKHGAGPLVSAFREVAPQFLEMLKGAKSTEDAFNIVTTAMSNVKDPAKKAVIATAAFGKTGQKFINLTNDGAEGIAFLRKEARKYGIMTATQAANSEKLGDAIGRIVKGFEGLLNSAIGPLLPALEDLADKFGNFIIEMRPEITKFAQEFAKDLPKNIEMLKAEFGELKKSLKPVLEFGKELIKKFGLLKLSMVAVGAFIAGPLLIPLAGLAVSLGGLAVSILPAVGVALTFLAQSVLIPLAGVILPALGTALGVVWGIMVANPIGLVITAVAALGFGAYKLIKNWDTVKEYFKGFWVYLNELFDGSIAKISGKMSGMFNFLPKGVKSFFGIDVPQVMGKVAPTKLEQVYPKKIGNGTQAIGVGPREFTSTSSETKKHDVTLTFDNLPPGTKINNSKSNKDKDFKLFMNKGPQGAFGNG